MGIIVKQGESGQVMKLLKGFLYGLQYLNATFYSYVQAKFEELKYNSQLVYLKKRLNDLFDADLRRIYIINSSTVNQTWLYRYTENNPVYIYRYPENNPVFVKRYSEEFTVNDFAIFVPNGLIYSQALFNSIVNRYKLSDRNFTINTYMP